MVQELIYERITVNMDKRSNVWTMKQGQFWEIEKGQTVFDLFTDRDICLRKDKLVFVWCRTDKPFFDAVVMDVRGRLFKIVFPITVSPVTL